MILADYRKSNPAKIHLLSILFQVTAPANSKQEGR